MSDQAAIDTGVVGLMGAGGLVLWLAQSVWNKVFSRPDRASDELYKQLADRIAELSGRQEKIEVALDDERKRRREVEDRAHALELDNIQLRAELKRHGIDIPPSFIRQPQVEPAGEVGMLS